MHAASSYFSSFFGYINIKNNFWNDIVGVVSFTITNNVFTTTCNWKMLKCVWNILGGTSWNDNNIIRWPALWKLTRWFLFFAQKITLDTSSTHRKNNKNTIPKECINWLFVNRMHTYINTFLQIIKRFVEHGFHSPFNMTDFR